MERNIILVATAIILLYSCKDKVRREEVIVDMQPVATEQVEIYGEYVGRIRAMSFVEVRARVEGYLEKMLFEEGKRVEQNKPLFMIDQTVYKAKRDRAAAQLQKDLAQEAKTKRDVERLRPLYEQHAASQLDLDNAVAAYESAHANVAMSRADLAQADLELSYTVVKSPTSGYIGERTVDVGALVGPGSKSLLATIVKSDTVLVDFSLTALDYLRSQERDVRLGEQDTNRSWQPTVSVTLADNSVYPMQGIVDFADPQVDPQTGTFGVRAALPNPDQKLLPGQFTRVKLLLDVRENAVVIPIRALVVEKGGAYVYVVHADSTAERRFIEIGPEVNNKVVVERGLSEGEIIVTEGYHKLSPGVFAIQAKKEDEQAN
ncbi:MAG: efflux RND transporter periplasmic adaptor subunit [Culturomica sp.]|jgi:membrane fusion protein (multidrug efflux system)|nr:efflux RND transporter periplasmic adaptor subunit [Culturomica sp.]